MGSETTPSIAGLRDADSRRSTVINAFAKLGGGDVFDAVADFVQSIGQRSPHAVALGVLGPGGASNASLVGRLRRDHPGLGMVVVCDTTPLAVQQLPHLVRAGADEVVLTVMATAAELVATVDRACARRREASVWHRIAPAIPEACHDIFEFCFTSALARRKVGDLARHLGVDRSTIALRLRRAGLPPAHTILSWSRLIAMAGLMESTRISVEQAAHEAGFGSAAGLRALSRRMMCATPRALAAGGRRIVMEEFLSLLDRCKAYDLVETGGTVQSSDECENNHVTRDAT